LGLCLEFLHNATPVRDDLHGFMVGILMGKQRIAHMIEILGFLRPFHKKLNAFGLFSCGDGISIYLLSISMECNKENTHIIYCASIF